MRLAGGDLLRERVAISRRPALEDVRDEDVCARQLDAREELVEQLPRLPDERDALLILVETRRLADEHQVGVRAPGAEHDLRAALARARSGCSSRSPRRTLEVRLARSTASIGRPVYGVARMRCASGESRSQLGRSRTSRRSNRRRRPRGR